MKRMKTYSFGLAVLTICILSSIGFFTLNMLTATLHISVHAVPTSIELGDEVTISANITDYLGTPIDDATVTATIGDYKIIYFLPQHGQGHYSITVHTPMQTPGTYVITILVQKEEVNLAQASTHVNVVS
jgi:hypothetical protein